jgi:hypothetical protein
MPLPTSIANRALARRIGQNSWLSCSSVKASVRVRSNFLCRQRVSQAFIDAEMEKDPASTAAPSTSQRSEPISTPSSAASLSRHWGIHEREYLNGNRYAAFVDPSGGSADAMTLAIAAQNLLLMHGV